MVELEEFLDFVIENLSDPRVDFYKKMKYGYRHYFINITLKYPEDEQRNRDSKTLQIIVDCRNNCIEVGQWEEMTVFESPEVTQKWANRLEEIYQSKLSSCLEHKISKFFNDVDPKDKDLGRRWKMKDWFNDNEEKENPTE